MQGAGFFEAVPIWAVFVGTLVVVVVSVEAGYRWARHKMQLRAEHEREKEAPVGAMVGATLGLLAFLLAFTFGMAADGFHARKVALLDEANGIRTTYLRATLIPEPHRVAVRKLLREYVEERLQWAGLPAQAPVRPARDLLNELWDETAAVGREQPGQDVIALFVESANRVIEAHAERVMLRERSRIPGEFWGVLYLISVLGLAAMGYHGGVAGTTRSPVMAAVALAFSLVILVTVDLDRPGEGWVNVGQDAMLDLRSALAEPHR